MKAKIILKSFLKEFWYAPADAFLRTAETLIWRQVEFKSPILDIGCGDGSISKLLFQQRKIDVGLDSNPQAVKQCSHSGVYRKVVKANASKMPFKNNSFQTVISNSTFEHIKNDTQAIAEAARVLTPKGCLLITVPSKRFQAVIKQILNNPQEFKNFNQRLHHFHYYDIKEWRKILSSNNFKINSYQYYFPPQLVKVWYRLFKIATFKLHKRELWSYLQTSIIKSMIPSRLVVFILEKYLLKYFKYILDAKGCFVLISAYKIK